MLRSLYIAGTGMLTERNRMNVITNNITNVDTLGYKKDTMVSRSFRDMLIDRLNDPSVISQTTEVGPLNTGVHVDEVMVSYLNGSPEQTDLNTDLCLTGPGFFVVSTEDGDRYTRAGNFSLNAQGYLVDANGYYVQGEGGAQIQLQSDQFKVKEDGAIIDLQTFEEIGRLLIVEFENTGELRKGGDNLFYDYGDANPGEAQSTNVLQGFIETSNVNIAQEMVNMIISSRTFESNQRAARIIDETLQRTVNDIAKF